MKHSTPTRLLTDPAQHPSGFRPNLSCGRRLPTLWDQLSEDETAPLDHTPKHYPPTCFRDV